jgi:hypothetical protein
MITPKPSLTYMKTPTPAQILPIALAISASIYFTGALTTIAGKVKCWGAYLGGRLSDTTTINFLTPGVVINL